MSSQCSHMRRLKWSTAWHVGLATKGEQMRVSLVLMMIYVLLCNAGIAHADVFNLGNGLTNLATVKVGDAGNATDKRYSTSGYGAVSYNYAIGKYEVTAAQYCDFLNHKAATDTYKLYNTLMGDISNAGCNIQRSGSSGHYAYSVAADWANRPVNYVSCWDAFRFVNWISNGQENGDTENGAYTLNGYNDWQGSDIQRNAGATWFIPSEDEWYKAAYYKGGGTSAGYWDYATRSNLAPYYTILNPDVGNGACYYGLTLGNPYWRTNVGEFENSKSAYGTFDQAGNVTEWTETVVVRYHDIERSTRGGAYLHSKGALIASYTDGAFPSGENMYTGFRVAAAVPEPSSMAVLGTGVLLLIKLRRRRS